jgi:hypothetical protein
MGNLVDWEKFYCFVCKEQFGSKQALQGHCINSKYHKVNKKDYKNKKRIMNDTSEYQKLDDF